MCRPASPLASTFIGCCLQGTLYHLVKVDESTWTVIDGVLTLTLIKRAREMWWNCVVKGHPEIDVKTVQPQATSISQLEGDTRMMVEKMMVDQRNKAMGLPTTKEQGKLDQLKRLQKLHPEFDWSKAKEFDG